tara:strand:- start:430 stop:675 length:246 start_codon:yes stop_codon:yes gene_type:complete
VNERMDEMMEIVRVIQSEYVPNGELNKKIEGMESDLSGIYKIAERNRAFSEKVQFDSSNNIRQLNDRLNKIGQDPGLQSNY